VGVPEEGGHDLISPDPLPPGCVYGADVSPDDKVALYRVEVTKLPGTGKLRIAGSPARALRDSVSNAYDYICSRRREIGLDDQMDVYDYHTQVIALMSNQYGTAVGMSFFVALYSALKNRSPLPSLVVLGQVTIGGHILSVRSLAEVLQAAMDNGAKRALIPVESKRMFLEVSGDVVEKVDPIFYADPLTAAIKGLGLN
jgi:ATP-dependent Lon protease